jgi:hypothetical protein
LSSGTVYDPVYGTPQGRGVYKTTEVGVGVGGNGPGSSDKDRAVMETELSEKGLPEGSASSPIAGCLYFIYRKVNKAIYQLQYLVNGQKVLLTLN